MVIAWGPGMPDSKIHRFVTLTVALAVLFLTACSMFGGNASDPLDDLREHVRSVVHDEDRAGAMLASVGQLDQLLKESAELLTVAVRQERLLFLDYDSTLQDFETLFSEVSRKRQDLQDAMLDVHLEFKDEATSEEWQAILPVHASALAMRVESLIVAAFNERG